MQERENLAAISVINFSFCVHLGALAHVACFTADQIVLAGQAFDAVRDYIVATPLEHNCGLFVNFQKRLGPAWTAAPSLPPPRPGKVLNHHITRAVEAAVTFEVEITAGPVDKVSVTTALQRTVNEQYVPALADSFGAYLPGSALTRIKGGQQQFLNEFRRITTLFMLLPEQSGFRDAVSNLTRPTPEEATSRSAEDLARVEEGLWQLQQIVGIIGDVARSNGGDIRQVITDDKGTVAIVIFGLQASARTPARAVTAAVNIYQQLRKVNADIQIGITTGRSFCGTIGSSDRKEYAVVGNKVNMAARLMASVTKCIPGVASDNTDPRILCDLDTMEAVTESQGQKDELSAQQLEFRALTPIKLKGLEQPAPIFQPILVAARASIKTSGEVKTAVLEDPNAPGLVTSPTSAANQERAQHVQRILQRRQHTQVLVGRDAELLSFQVLLRAFNGQKLSRNIIQPLQFPLLQFHHDTEGHALAPRLHRRLSGLGVSAHTQAFHSHGSLNSPSAAVGGRTRTMVSFAFESVAADEPDAPVNPCTFVIEGAVGSGKSLLVRNLSGIADEMGVRVVHTEGNESERFSAFVGFHRLVAGLLRPYMSFSPYVSEDEIIIHLLNGSQQFVVKLTPLQRFRNAVLMVMHKRNASISVHRRLSFASGGGARGSLKNMIESAQKQILHEVARVFAHFPFWLRTWWVSYQKLLPLLLDIHAPHLVQHRFIDQAVLSMDNQSRTMTACHMLVSLWQAMCLSPAADTNSNSAAQRYLLVIEDYQFLDSSSESLLCEILDHLAPFVAVAITCRPSGSSSFAVAHVGSLEVSHKLLCSRPQVQYVRLSGLSQSSVREILIENFEVAHIQPEVC